MQIIHVDTNQISPLMSAAIVLFSRQNRMTDIVRHENNTNKLLYNAASISKASMKYVVKLFRTNIDINLEDINHIIKFFNPLQLFKKLFEFDL